MTHYRRCTDCGVDQPYSVFESDPYRCRGCVTNTVPAPMMMAQEHQGFVSSPMVQVPGPMPAQEVQGISPSFPLPNFPTTMYQDRQATLSPRVTTMYRPMVSESRGYEVRQPSPMQVERRIPYSDPGLAPCPAPCPPAPCSAASFSSPPYPATSYPQSYYPQSPCANAPQTVQAPVTVTSPCSEPGRAPCAQFGGAITGRVFQQPKRGSYHDSVLDCIGKTPMVKLNRVTQGVTAQKVLVKLEMQNPGGSGKDRIAQSMLEAAEKAGDIAPGKNTIIEYTTNNAGVGVAMVCAAKGYSCIIVMPQLPAMKERYMFCRKFGAQVHLTSAALGMSGAEQYVNEQLEQHPDYWCPRQFENPANPQVHMDTTGPEIWEQTGGEIDYLVVGAGTGGTVSALACYLKGRNPSLKVVAVEPTESRVLAGGRHTPHTISGLGEGIPLPFVEQLAPGQEWGEGPRGPIDEFLHCTSEDATAMVDQLAAKEGLLVGPSSGAVVHVALEVARRPETACRTVVAITASSAVRYMSHALWATLREESDEALPSEPEMDSEPLLRWTSPASEAGSPPPSEAAGSRQASKVPGSRQGSQVVDNRRASQDVGPRQGSQAAGTRQGSQVVGARRASQDAARQSSQAAGSRQASQAAAGSRQATAVSNPRQASQQGVSSRQGSRVVGYRQASQEAPQPSAQWSEEAEAEAEAVAHEERASDQEEGGERQPMFMVEEDEEEEDM